MRSHDADVSPSRLTDVRKKVITHPERNAPNTLPRRMEAFISSQCPKTRSLRASEDIHTYLLALEGGFQRQVDFGLMRPYSIYSFSFKLRQFCLSAEGFRTGIHEWVGRGCRSFQQMMLLGWGVANRMLYRSPGTVRSSFCCTVDDLPASLAVSRAKYSRRSRLLGADRWRLLGNSTGNAWVRGFRWINFDQERRHDCHGDAWNLF